MWPQISANYRQQADEEGDRFRALTNKAPPPAGAGAAAAAAAARREELEKLAAKRSRLLRKAGAFTFATHNPALVSEGDAGAVLDLLPGQLGRRRADDPLYRRVQVDLHGLRRAEAVRFVAEAVDALQTGAGPGRAAFVLSVIVGRGNHSAAGAVLRPAVERMLAKAKLGWDETSAGGCLNVRLPPGR